jgi:hypothetical protein
VFSLSMSIESTLAALNTDLEASRQLQAMI